MNGGHDRSREARAEWDPFAVLRAHVIAVFRPPLFFELRSGSDLNPNIKKEAWTPEEDQILMLLQQSTTHNRTLRPQCWC